MRYLRRSAFCLLSVLALSAIAGCVPSPTATPPRQSPFPTLPLITDTPTPNPNATGSPNQPTPQATLLPEQTIAATPLPLPTDGSHRADTLPPIVQVTVQDPALPVSIGQAVALNVLAADDNYVVRLDLYDNNALFAQSPALAPAAVYSNQFVWKMNMPGRHTLRAIAYDAHGNASAPVEIQISVITNNRAPAVQITAPSGSKDAEIGAPVLIQGVATDDVAVTRLELLVDNQLVTFAAPDTPGGVTPFAAAFSWTPTKTGVHAIVLRAYDNQGQSDDSLRYTVRVFDNQPPTVRASSERSAIPSDDALVVHALALSNNGISRVELYVDDVISDAVNSSAPAQQTALNAELAAGNLVDGAHTFFVRAYDSTGQTADTPHATFTVSANAPRIARETPPPRDASTQPPALPTATRALFLPEPPTVEVRLVGDAPRVTLPNPAALEITAQGSTELDRIELWARYPGETMAQMLLDENVKGATAKTLRLDWVPPRAGVVELEARVRDGLGQARRSPLLRAQFAPPPVPTSVPAVYNFAQTWRAESPAARYEVTFTQIGRALRGTFVEKRADGTTLNGQVVSGAAGDQNALFAVDFARDASAPQHTLEFDCTFAARPPQLTCNFADENGNRGSAIFAPLVQP